MKINFLKTTLLKTVIPLSIGFALGLLYFNVSLEAGLDGNKVGSNIIITGTCNVLPTGGQLNLTNDQVRILSINETNIRGIFIKQAVNISCPLSSIYVTNFTLSQILYGTRPIQDSETEKKVVRDEVEDLDQKSILITGECLVSGESVILSSRLVDVVGVFNDSGTLSIRGIVPSTEERLTCKKGMFRFREVRSDYDKILEREKEMLFPKVEVVVKESSGLEGKNILLTGECLVVSSKNRILLTQKNIFVTKETIEKNRSVRVIGSMIDKKGSPLLVDCDKRKDDSLFWAVTTQTQDRTPSKEAVDTVDRVLVTGACTVEGESAPRVFFENEVKVSSLQREAGKIVLVSGYIKIGEEPSLITCDTKKTKHLTIKELN